MKSSVIVAGAGLQGPQGIAGINGTNGLNGADGKTVLYGTVDPTTEGNNGDFYINTTTHCIFGPKTAGVWPAGVSLIGPQGNPGADGADGTYRDVTISPESPTGIPTTGALWFQVEA